MSISAMNEQYTKSTRSARLIFENPEKIAQWVSVNLFGEPDGFENFAAVGVMVGDKVVAGIVYNNMMVARGEPYCIEMSIFSIDSSWCSRHTLRALFSIPFTQYKLRRVQALCSAKDKGVQMFLKRLGFIHEGVHPCAYHDGGTAYSFGMLKHNCKWI